MLNNQYSNEIREMDGNLLTMYGKFFNLNKLNYQSYLNELRINYVMLVLWTISFCQFLIMILNVIYYFIIDQ